jgi:hypothetical protein
MKRIAKVAAVGAAGLGLLLGSSPAQAGTTGALAFVGSANLNPGLAYPVLGAGSGGTWDFTIDTGVGATTGGQVGTATGGITTPGTLTAGEVLNAGPFAGGGFCGASGGVNGSGAIAIGSDTLPLNTIGWNQSAASLLVFTNNNGDVAGASIVGAVSAIPPTPVSGTGSCLSGTATKFTIVGAGVALDA